VRRLDAALQFPDSRRPVSQARALGRPRARHKPRDEGGVKSVNRRTLQGAFGTTIFWQRGISLCVFSTQCEIPRRPADAGLLGMTCKPGYRTDSVRGGRSRSTSACISVRRTHLPQRRFPPGGAYIVHYLCATPAARRGGACPPLSTSIWPAGDGKPFPYGEWRIHENQCVRPPATSIRPAGDGKPSPYGEWRIHENQCMRPPVTSICPAGDGKPSPCGEWRIRENQCMQMRGA
jgi:hypothetical protein